MEILFLLWFIVVIIQVYLGLGTAYRATKRGGDNGFALFGWMFVYELAALVPGLGFYLWKISFDDEKPKESVNPSESVNPNEPANSQLIGPSENWTYNPETQQAQKQQSTNLDEGAFTNQTDNERHG